MDIYLNPEKYISRNRQDSMNQQNKNMYTIQSPSYEFLEQLSQFPLHKDNNLQKNSHVPSIFKKNSHTQIKTNTIKMNYQLLISTQKKVDVNCPVIQNKKSIQMVQSLELPETKNHNDDLIPRSITQNLCLSSTKQLVKSQQTYQQSRAKKLNQRNLKSRNYKKSSPRSSSPPPSFLKKNSKINAPNCQTSIGISNFKLGRYMGMGRFGKYFQAIHIETGFLVCLKRLDKQEIISSRYVEKIIQSLKWNMLMNYPTIRKLFGVFQDANFIFLILQYTQLKTLSSYIKNHQSMSQAQSAQKLREIGSAIRYIHKKQLIHRGINSQSILVTYGVCKLSNFELIQQIGNHSSAGDKINDDKLISLNYQRKSITYSYDMWCLGALAYEMIVGKSLMSNKIFYKLDPQKVIFPLGISLRAKDLILKLIESRPSNRISIDEMLECPFLTQNMGQTSLQKDIKKDTKDELSYPRFFALKRALTRG